MRAILVTAGMLTVLGSTLVENVEIRAVPSFVYILGLLVLTAGLLGKRFTVKRMALAIVVLAVALRVTYSGVSSLRHRVGTIRPGMTVEEVRRHMAGFQEGLDPEGPHTVGPGPIAEGSMAFRDLSASRSHHAYGWIVIERGRVKEAGFMPD